jgi:hypothetical protein
MEQVGSCVLLMQICQYQYHLSLSRCARINSFVPLFLLRSAPPLFAGQPYATHVGVDSDYLCVTRQSRRDLTGLAFVANSHHWPSTNACNEVRICPTCVAPMRLILPHMKGPKHLSWNSGYHLYIFSCALHERQHACSTVLLAFERPLTAYSCRHFAQSLPIWASVAIMNVQGSHMLTLFLSLGVLVGFKLWNSYQWKSKYKLPPGPKGIPYFGNMFQIPPYHQGPWAKRLAEQYGEMYV